MSELAGEVRVPARPPAAGRGVLWVEQSWEHLLFAHWRLEAAVVRRALPPALELDTWDGAAYVAVVPFLMAGVRGRFLPPVPGTDEFPELNVRTYVRHGGVSGVWFFSLDAASRLAVTTARVLWGLPYFRADMTIGHEDGWVRYRSRRVADGAPPAEYRARYRPAGPAFRAEPGTLEHWLTERYSLFVADPRGRVRRGDIDHPPWELHVAEAEVEVDGMGAAAGLPASGAPDLLHFARRQPTRAWLPRRVGQGVG